MTGAPPDAPPPSDTLERLPDDFWDTAMADVDVAEGTERSSPSDEPAAAVSGTATEQVATSPPPHPRSAGAEPGVAVLQRLFPGRVLGVEPHVGDEHVATDAIDSGDGSGAVATGDDAPDAAPAEGGLESDRSRR